MQSRFYSHTCVDMVLAFQMQRAVVSCDRPAKRTRSSQAHRVENSSLNIELGRFRHARVDPDSMAAKVKMAPSIATPEVPSAEDAPMRYLTAHPTIPCCNAIERRLEFLRNVLMRSSLSFMNLEPKN